jgi:mRNA interferase RelE/StbE
VANSRIALRGVRGAYRLRVGDYRVIYTMADGRLVVVVVDLGHRREICDALPPGNDAGSGMV